ncbi:cbb3-type cytochrome oxidase assembly protein CcoS [Candidatus Neomarinimicrobiota bacterium]
MLCIGFSLFIAVGFLALFLWAVRNGQFEDQVTPSIRMLFDHRTEKSPPKADSRAGHEPFNEGVVK